MLPAVFAEDGWSPPRARAELSDFMDACNGDCHVELIMKDISTLRNHPERLWEWASIAMEVAHEYAR